MKTIRTSFSLRSSYLAVAATAAALAGASPSPYGVCAHLHRVKNPQERVEECHRIEATGIGRVRFDLEWWRIQKGPGEPFDFSHYDAVMADAEARGLTVLPIIYVPPKWAKPIWEHLDDWARYVEASVAHYGDKFPDIEIWNEQNLSYFWGGNPDPEKYVAVLRAAYEAAKRANPGVRVLFGGVSGVPLDFIEKVYEHGGAKYFDAMNVHPYSHPRKSEGSLDVQLEKLRALMAKNGDEKKPVIITEHGWPTRVADGDESKFADSEENQARFLARAMAIAFAEGVEQYFWYEFRAPEKVPNSSEDHFGLTHQNFTPKPAWGAYRNFILARPAGSVQTPGPWHNEVRRFFFPQWTRPDGTKAGILWTTGQPEKRPLRFDGEKILFRDYKGRLLAPARMADGEYIIPLSGDPIYFEGGALAE